MLGISILVLCNVGLSGGRSSHGRWRGACGIETAIYEIVLDTFGQVPERLNLPTPIQQSREVRFIGRHRELDIGS